MANLKFARGTTVPTYSTDGFTDGCLYFNTSNQNIYLRNGTSNYSSTVEVFKGTDTLPQYRVRQSGGNFATINYQMPLSAYIQGVPMSSDDSTAVNWYNLYGQGVAQASALMHDTVDVGFDEVMVGIKDLPPLDNARYIVCAVNLRGLAHAIRGAGGTPSTMMLPSAPYMCIVTCYRTTESSCCTDASNTDWSTVTTKPMFVGHCCPKIPNQHDDTIYTSDFLLYLCCNGTNDVYVQCHFNQVTDDFESANDMCKMNPFGSHSGLTFFDTSVPTLEQYIYPLYIQY